MFLHNLKNKNPFLWTKGVFYDKINIMKFNRLKYKFLISFLTLLLSCLTFSFLLLQDDLTVHANNTDTERILPISVLENYPLTSPVNAYIDDEIVAIIQADNSLVIYQNEKFTKLTSTDKNFTSLKQVERFSDGELIVSDNGSVYRVNLNTYNVSLLTLGSELIGCTSFDFNGEYLVTTYGVKAFFYEVSGGNIVKMLPPLENVTDTTIAVNSTSVFYVSNNKIYSRDFNDFQTEREVFPVSPSKIIATDQFIFYILDGNVYRLNLDGSRTEMLAFPESHYDLGKIQTATDIAMRNGKLLVTDKENDSIQEFEIVENRLLFTGFAIANGKTAYNRIANAKSVEKYGSTVAVLQDYKITLFDTNVADYNEQTYTNLLIGQAPDFFAYSGQTIFGAQKDGSAFILDIKTGEKTPVTLSTDVVDVCFRCNYYYALTSSSTSSTVYKINQQGEVVNEKNYTQHFNVFEVDVSNNYYFADDYSIYKDNGENLSFYSSSFQNVIKKLASDLSGELYVLGASSIFTLNFDSATPNAHPYPIGVTPIDFCMSIDDASVYLLEKGKESLYQTSALENVAISSITIPNDFTLSGQSADENNLKVYTVTDGANTFSVNIINNGFEYVSTLNSATDYLFIEEITLKQNCTLYLLADRNGLTVVNKNDCSEKTLTSSVAPSKAFTATTVHAYYLPLITMEMEYAIDNNGSKLLLDKKVEITPLNSYTIFDTDFYFAKIIVDGNEINCFIPVNFTVEILSEDKEFSHFVIKSINATALYSNKEMTDKILDLPKSQVRIYEDDGTVAKITYLSGEQWIEGYISSQSIIDTSKNAVRNVLIVLAVITSLCGTASFFLLKKFR